MNMMLESPIPMAKTQKTSPVRLTDEAVKLARIASGYTGESVAEYVSRIVSEKSRADISALHDSVLAIPDSATKAKKPKR